MTKEEKYQLLLKDLCARLPYGVICNLYDVEDANKKFLLRELSKLNILVVNSGCIKPYLRPMSSMTEKEIKEYWKFVEHRKIIYDNGSYDGAWNILRLDIPNHLSNFIDWLNAHQLDYRGLIPMGLALEAPEGMYKTE